MKKLIISLITISMTFASEPIKTAVLGLGGRAQNLLLECLSLKDETDKELKVVAVCDDHAFACLTAYTQMLGYHPQAKAYKKMFSKASYYPDTPDGLKQLFKEHPDVDRILITSANNRHLAHLSSALTNSPCQNIFIEKPLFCNLDEFKSFASCPSTKRVAVGLTLRYSNMTRIVCEKLKQYQAPLGQLKKVKAWEHVSFGHAFTMIMMNWRRYQSVSGGLLIEKSVHDLDLSLTFMQALGCSPKTLSITTKAFHELFKKSNQAAILNHLQKNAYFAQNVAGWDTIPWQRTISFVYNQAGLVNWPATCEAFFKEFPANDDFSKSDIIPDHQKLTAKMITQKGHLIDFELDVCLTGSLSAKRGVQMEFEKGEVIVDVIYGKMWVKQHGKYPLEIDLQTNGRAHAGGDTFVAHTILDTLPQGQHQALIQDPAVQLSSLMGLVSEYQALHHLNSPIHLTQRGNQWKIDFPTKN